MGTRQILPQRYGEPMGYEGETYEVFPYHSSSYLVEDWRDCPPIWTVAGILEYRWYGEEEREEWV